jgi:hypothetical protein
MTRVKHSILGLYFEVNSCARRGAFHFWGVMPFRPESLKFKGESVI